MRRARRLKCWPRDCRRRRAQPSARSFSPPMTRSSKQDTATKDPVILVRAETTPEDIHGMEVAKGILTSRGGMTSHAAVVTRGMGKCCVAGAGDIDVDEKAQEMLVKGQMFKAGDWISLDGTTGRVIKGKLNTLDPSPDDPELQKFMAWVDPYRILKVRANADIPRDAIQARAFGAEGIGLCRTEHMFFGEEKIPHMRAMILANNEKDRRAALEETAAHAAQRLHRRVPRHGRLPGHHPHARPAAARVPATSRRADGGYRDAARSAPRRRRLVAKYKEYGAKVVGDLKKLLPTLLARVEQLHEFNPMLGHRGCRLGITYPEITEMQARAIFEAAVAVAKDGVKVIPRGHDSAGCHLERVGEPGRRS